MSYVKYIQSLDSEQKRALFSNSQTARSIFRMLDPLSRNIVIRLFHSGKVNNAERALLFGQNPRVLESIKELTSLGVVTQTITPSDASNSSKRRGFVNSNTNSGKSNIQLLVPKKEKLSSSESELILSLDDNFCTSFRQVLEEEINESSFELIDIAEKLQEAKQKWDYILLFILQFCEDLDKTLLDPERSDPNATIIQSIEKANLVLKKTGRAQSRYQLTEAGFRFLLKNTTSQLWTILKSFIQLKQAGGISQLKIVSFLLRLSFNTRGKPIPIKTLTQEEISLIDDFENLGLIISVTDNIFPTPLASALVSSTHSQIQNSKQGRLLVESNFHIYYYTKSSADIAIVSLFSKLIVTLPNMVVSHMDYASALNAFKRGAKASDIVSYLRDNMSEKMESVPHSVVSTVLDQILLWESERARVQFTSGVLYDGFENDEYELVANFADEKEYIIWRNDEQQLLFVREDAHEEIKAFIKLIKSGA